MVTWVTKALWLRDCGLPAAFLSVDITCVVSFNDLHECLDMEEKEKGTKLTNVSKNAISSNWRFAKENWVLVETFKQLRNTRAGSRSSWCQSGARPPILLLMSHDMRSKVVVHLPAISVTCTETEVRPADTLAHCIWTDSNGSVFRSSLSVIRCDACYWVLTFGRIKHRPSLW